MILDSGQAIDQGKTSEAKLLTLGDLIQFFHRRRSTVLLSVFVCFLVAIGYCAFATRRYQSESVVEIKPPEDSLGLNSLVQGNTQQSGEQNPLEENVTLATKVSELESETLALRVIQQLNLETTEDFKPHLNLNPLPILMAPFMPAAKKDAPGTPFLESPVRRAKAFDTFERHLKVEIVPGTRLISISYQNPDPEVAANVANAMVNDLAQYTFETRYKATQQLSTWLGDQIDSVREQAESMQQQEAQLRRETETYNMGGTNAAGQTMVYSPLLDHLQQATQALSQAESNRILRGAVNQIVQTRNPVLISGLAGSGLASSGNPASVDSLTLIRDLQSRLAQQRLLVAQDEQRYGSANPKLIQERAQLQSLEDAVREETDRLASRAKNDYTVAEQQEHGAAAERQELIKRANLVNDKVLQYEIVRQQADDARQLYTDLDRRLHEAGVLAGLQSNDMTVISKAFASDKPASPKILLALAGSICVGCLLGVIFAGIQDVRDDKVSSVEAVEKELGIPVYAITPDFNAEGVVYGYGRYLYGRYGGKRKKAVKEEEEKVAAAHHAIHVVAEPESQYSEAMRTLRTAILLSRPGSAVKTILIASSTPGEGKSTTSSNLGATFARTGSRTLLVEVDLRKPVLARRLGLPPSTDGLSRILTGQLDRNYAVPVPGVPNLHCIPSGQRPPDPHELISSETMKELLDQWRGQYDLVILDGPPVLPVIDSVLISEHADLVLVITRFGRTSINSLRTTHRLLSRQVRANIGAVLNAVSQGSEGYYSYYGYRNNSYKYSGEGE
ncbi:capsular exopolysaccharide family [Bryocella elongata]|uniref:non-specific protein-tyrosine kinase n=1 Tax=Bryocella elongata TaxID=863522 RepID=A0A1H5UDT3_9BACT|nr:polysaccharide biosynthesis tyrosine autokinase [Bryocella elongata]SEF72598.1 capsular exopolysaccharide family [Bryocella elongata]